MIEWATNFLISLTGLLVNNYHSVGTADWAVVQDWNKTQHGWEYIAELKNPNVVCKNSKDKIQLPQVIHGVHEIIQNSRILYSTGDPTFAQATSFYDAPVVSCSAVRIENPLQWKVITYSKYFARFSEFPKNAVDAAATRFFNVTANTIAAGVLIVLAAFAAFMFTGRVQRRYVLSLVIGSIMFSIYAAMTTADNLGISISMITAHKIADVAVWTASLAYIYFFRRFNVLGQIEFYAFTLAFFIAQIFIIFGENADTIQLGTTIPIPFAFICLASFLINSFIEGMKSKFDKHRIFSIASIFLFSAAGMNDAFHITGISQSVMIMPFASVFGVFFLAIAVNQDIENTYSERNDLFKNLEIKVKEQTEHLSLALEQVKKSQAELVQSARLASLGTLSAGIAHEINNSINFVSGAIIPLERRVLKFAPETEKEIIGKLFAAIKEGTNLTVEIVRSLRNFTGLNQAKVKEASIKSMVDSVITILKSRLSQSAIEVEVDIDAAVTLECHQVGINQVFMNLISNSIDAVKNSGGKVKVTAILLSKDTIRIQVSDNGTGIPEKIKDRIFDPFFTTKDIGKGTGLGLHIVQKEIERHNGIISVESAVDDGTKFTIDLPRYSNYQKVSEAS